MRGGGGALPDDTGKDCYLKESALPTCSFLCATFGPTHRLFLQVLSCACSKCNFFKHAKGLWLIYSQTTASFQQRAGCKCDQCRKFYTLPGDKWNEVSASDSFSRVHLTELISATPVVHNVTHTVQPTPTLHKSTAIHLISSSATFLDTPFGMAMQSPPHNDSVVYLHKGECHIAQHPT